MSPRRRTKQPQHRPLRRGMVVAFAAVALASVALIAGLVFWSLSSGGGSTNAGPKTAAIVDQLSLTQPNPDFAQAATSILEDAGYSVDYYAGEEVTVEFYRQLPTHEYHLLIMRVHSGLARDNGKPTDYVSLFTGEPFSEIFHDTATFEDAEAGRLGRATYYEGGAAYYGIVPAFIESSMRGTFQDATVILMGCDGLTTNAAAEAFVSKGAKTVVGWSGRVSAEHTDAAAEHLLRHLLVEGHATREAVALTMAEVGPDPTYGSTLLSYP